MPQSESPEFPSIEDQKKLLALLDNGQPWLDVIATLKQVKAKTKKNSAEITMGITDDIAQDLIGMVSGRGKQKYVPFLVIFEAKALQEFIKEKNKRERKNGKARKNNSKKG